MGIAYEDRSKLVPGVKLVMKYKGTVSRAQVVEDEFGNHVIKVEGVERLFQSPSGAAKYLRDGRHTDGYVWFSFDTGQYDPTPAGEPEPVKKTRSNKPRKGTNAEGVLTDEAAKTIQVMIEALGEDPIEPAAEAAPESAEDYVEPMILV